MKRTQALVELHASNGVLVSPVVPGAITELRHPAPGRSIGPATVHQPIGNHQAQDRALVALHCLCEESNTKIDPFDNHTTLQFENFKWLIYPGDLKQNCTQGVLYNGRFIAY